MTDIERPMDPPAGGDRGERLQHEGALAELPVGDGQAARTERPAAPQDQVEIEHTRPPAASAATAEGALDGFEAGQHGGGLGIAFDQRHGIGEISAGATVGGVEHDRRRIEQAEVLVQPGDRGLDHAGGAAVTAVGTIGAECDGIEVTHHAALGTRTVLRQAQDERYG